MASCSWPPRQLLQQEAESISFPNHFPNFIIRVSIHQVAPHFPPPYPFPTHPYTTWDPYQKVYIYPSYHPYIFGHFQVGPIPSYPMSTHLHQAAPAEAAPPKGLKRKVLQAEPPKAKPMPLKRHAEAELAEAPPAARPSTKVVRAAKTQARKPSRTRGGGWGMVI